MKLSKLYSNKPEEFEPIVFTAGLNVVLAEIRLPKNRNKNTHNLGKSTLGRILDYCFLSGRDNKFFLFKHFDVFKDFVFFLEIELDNGSYLTVRRSVEEATKISFKRYFASNQNFSNVKDENWDHANVTFDRARSVLDGLIDWRAIKPWPYRIGLSYLLRAQEDYRDVFHLRKFAGGHSEWKPFLAHILGFDASLISMHYEKEVELEGKKATEQTIKNELGGSIEDISKIEGILLLKQQDADKKQGVLNAFDFRAQDRDKIKQLVDTVDERIATLNQERYSLNVNRKKIVKSLAEDNIAFDPDEAERLFKEVGVLFSGQIKKDYIQLIAFNKAIMDERRFYLKAELIDIDLALKNISVESNSLGKRRSDILSFLNDTDIFNKYKSSSDELVILKADITSLERQKVFLHSLQELRTKIRLLMEERGVLQSRIEADVEKQNSDRKSLFSTIRVYFSEIVEAVIDRKALLSVSPNKEGHLEFKAEILDESGNSTSADLGNTYRKLLCVAFDMAVLRGRLDDEFPKFVYHDGVFESLDDRTKENLLIVLREYSQLGIQHIITLIDSDLPVRSLGESPVFEQGEIILLLHDEGEKGRLFKMKSW